MLTLIRLLKCRGPRGTVLRAPPGFVLVERHFARFSSPPGLIIPPTGDRG